MRGGALAVFHILESKAVSGPGDGLSLQGLDAYLTSVVLRVGAGAGLAAAAVGSGQACATLAAFGLGVGAPFAVQKLALNRPLDRPLDDMT